MINLNARPATFIQYELGSVLMIDNPEKGGLPIEVDCDSLKKVDVEAAIAELCLITGLTPADFYLTVDE